MSITNSVNTTTSVDGRNFTQQKNITSNAAIRREIELSAAKIGSLTTRTDDNTGTLTMNAGHGISTGAKLDIYWLSGGIYYSRRNLTVGTVATNSVPIDGGSGDVLPSAATAITAMVPSSVEFRFDGDDLKVLVVNANAPCNVTLTGDDDAEDVNYFITENGQVKNWYSGSGETNPVATDTITKAWITHGDSSGSKVVKVAAAID